jgi:hypothetical protein
MCHCSFLLWLVTSPKKIWVCGVVCMFETCCLLQLPDSGSLEILSVASSLGERQTQELVSPQEMIPE